MITLIISHEEIHDIIKIVKSLEEFASNEATVPIKRSCQFFLC